MLPLPCVSHPHPASTATEDRGASSALPPLRAAGLSLGHPQPPAACPAVAPTQRFRRRFSGSHRTGQKAPGIQAFPGRDAEETILLRFPISQPTNRAPPRRQLWYLLITTVKNHNEFRKCLYGGRGCEGPAGSQLMTLLGSHAISVN